MRTMNRMSMAPLVIAVLVISTACACGPAGTGANHEVDRGRIEGPADLEPLALGPGSKLGVVSTTNIVGDVVAQVGGDRIEQTTLMGFGVDPHSYVPTPSHTAAIHDAQVVFANGAGLEADLEEMLQAAGGGAVHVHLSDGLELLGLAGELGAEGRSGKSPEAELDLDHANVDPHVWFSVPNVIHWVETIRDSLSALDPANSEFYASNAGAYIRELEELDAWIVEQVATIPQGNRKLVTNHSTFGYLAERYGLEQLGAVYPVNPSSDPSAQEIAALEDAILEFGVSAVFVESTVNPELAEQVAGDTGIRLVPLYTGSLAGPGSGVESYVDLIRFDVETIVEALK